MAIPLAAGKCAPKAVQVFSRAVDENSGFGVPEGAALAPYPIIGETEAKP